MNDERWDAVDAYTTGLLQGTDPVLEAAVRDSAELPNIAVSAAQGQFLHLIARAINARRILEIGTLGGYSAIWLGRALPDGGGSSASSCSNATPTSLAPTSPVPGSTPRWRCALVPHWTASRS